MRRAGFIGENDGSPDRSALLQEAAEHAQRALELRRRVHPPPADHMQIAEVLSLLGQVRMRQSRLEEALAPPRFRVECLPDSIRIHVCPGDFNGSGALSVQEIFDVLAACFAGCP